MRTATAHIGSYHITMGYLMTPFVMEANARWYKTHIRQNPMNLRITTKGDKMRKEIRNCENNNGGYRILKSIVKNADIIDFYVVKHSAPKTSPRVKFQIFTGFKRRQNGRGD